MFLANQLNEKKKKKAVEALKEKILNDKSLTKNLKIFLVMETT